MLNPCYSSKKFANERLKQSMFELIHKLQLTALIMNV